MVYPGKEGYMSPRSLSRISLLVFALALAAVLAFAACKDDKKEGTTPPADQTPAGIDISGVPELQDGVLNVGSDIAYAPFEFYIEGTETEDGLDIDIAKAIAAELGVDIEFINTGFDGLIPALQSAEFDILVSAMTIRPDREDQIDFVPYITVGTGIVVPAGNPDNITGLDESLCGLTLAVQVATIQVTFLEDLNEGACADNNVDIVTFDTNPLAVEDLRTGGSDANFSDFPVAAEDAAQSGGELEVVEPQIDPEPYGIGVDKGSTELKDVIADALQAIRDSGEYDQILAEWKLEAVALP
ncbi:MAG TPA: ABC transporter substrate-binding protein [Dehalococcoidia bacterium]|nr:ABC transporter substrate-binding protein [Dehalococcoidia bacterium]